MKKVLIPLWVLCGISLVGYIFYPAEAVNLLNAVNLAQVNAVTVLTGAGATGTGTQRVTAAQDTTTIAGSAPGTAGSASPNVVTVQGISSMTPVQVAQGCAGQSVANTTVTAINNAGASTNLKLVSKVSAQNVYICSLNLVAGGATNVALVDGTKTTNECDTSTAGMAGGATAATGWNLAANGGLSVGNGQGVVFKTTSTNFDVCLLFSAGNQVSGSITWAQF